MKRTLLILTMCGAVAVYGAIKRDPAAKAEPSPEPGQEKPKLEGGLLRELFKRGTKDGEFNPSPREFERLLREILGEAGVPKDELRGASVLELLRRLQSMDPESLPFFDGSGGAYLDPDEKKTLDAHAKGRLEGHKPGTVKASLATFMLHDAGKPALPIGFATGVNSEGWALTKASEVERVTSLEAQVKGRWVSAKVAHTWADHDLALLKLDVKEIPVVEWSNAMPGVGGFITAAAPNGRDPVAIGVVSVAARYLREKGRGFLGLRLGKDDKGLKVEFLVNDGAAIGAGVKLNDYIIELDGQKPESQLTFTKLVSDRKAGDKVKLKLKRGDEIIEKEIQLGDRGSAQMPLRPRLDRMNGMGSTISKRRDDFPNVVQTDFPIDANQCGGPVTDLDGNVVGMVIARSGRIETLILPAETISKALKDVDFATESGKVEK